jgi:hypothetical protein
MNPAIVTTDAHPLPRRGATGGASAGRRSVHSGMRKRFGYLCQISCRRTSPDRHRISRMSDTGRVAVDMAGWMPCAIPNNQRPGTAAAQSAVSHNDRPKRSDDYFVGSGASMASARPIWRKSLRTHRTTTVSVGNMSPGGSVAGGFRTLIGGRGSVAYSTYHANGWSARRWSAATSGHCVGYSVSILSIRCRQGADGHSAGVRKIGHYCADSGRTMLSTASATYGSTWGAEVR